MVTSSVTSLTLNVDRWRKAVHVPQKLIETKVPGCPRWTVLSQFLVSAALQSLARFLRYGWTVPLPSQTQFRPRSRRCVTYPVHGRHSLERRSLGTLATCGRESGHRRQRSFVSSARGSSGGQMTAGDGSRNRSLIPSAASPTFPFPVLSACSSCLLPLPPPPPPSSLGADCPGWSTNSSTSRALLPFLNWSTTVSFSGSLFFSSQPVRL